MNETMQALQKEQQKLQKISRIFLIGAILCLLIAIMTPQIGSILIVLMILIHVFGIRPANKRYLNTIKQTHIQEGFRSLIKQINYTEKNGISSDSIVNANFLPVAHANTVVIRDTVKGTYQAMPIVLSDVTTDYESAATANKSGIDYLPGLYMEVTLSKKPAFDFALLSEDSIPTAEFEKRHTGLIGSLIHTSSKNDHEYRLYLPEGIRADQISEETLTAFTLLDEYTPGKIAMQVIGEQVRFFIRGRFLYTHELKLQTSVTPQFLNSTPFPELHSLLRIVDTLKV